MIQFLQNLLRRAGSRLLLPGLFVMLLLCGMTDGPAPSSGDAVGSWRTRRNAPCAALLHQEVPELAFRPASGRERTNPLPVRRTARPDLEFVAVAVAIPVGGGRLPEVRPGAFHCHRVLKAVFPVRAGPVRS